MEKLEKIHKYISLSKLYLKNANEMIKKEEFSKSGEMLWGAISTLLKAIGMKYNKPIKNHKSLIQVAKYISLAEGDKELKDSIVIHAQALHANYYEGFIDKEEFPYYYEKMITAYGKLYNLIME